MDQDIAAKLNGIELALQALLIEACKYGGAGIRIANAAKARALEAARTTDEYMTSDTPQVTAVVEAIFKAVPSNTLR